MKMLSFTHLHVPKLIFFFLSFEHKYILKNVDYQTVAGSH